MIRTSVSTIATPQPKRPGQIRHRRAGYTLTEVVIVMGILVLVMALAVPAFNFITGSRSLEAAQNTVSAMLGRARSLALYQGKPAGVYCTWDSTRNRVTMALVQAQTADSNVLVFVAQDRQPLQPSTGIKGIGIDYDAANNKLKDPVLIVFDSLGRLSLSSYKIGNASATASVAQIGLVLHDRESYDSQATPAGQLTWVKANGSFLMINRYNGTFLRNE